ncbi:MAG: NADH-quinone oxidoreductase subunit H [Patescibacteria group bacterium]
MTTSILLTILQILMAPLLAPLCLGIIRKSKAFMQNRKGASIFQPYRDIFKLMKKDEVIAHEASWIFRAAPYIVFTATLAAAASVPVFTTVGSLWPLGDIIMVVYLIALATFFLALAGLDVGTAFGGTGSSREMTMAALAEGGMMAVVLAVVTVAHTANITDITSFISHASFFTIAPLLLALAAFFIVLLCENARYPFDNPATHLELTMIHEAMILEYSGKRLALMEWAAAIKLFLFIALAINLFFPWGIANTLDPYAFLIGAGLFAAKALVVLLVITFFESWMPKLRFFRLPDLLFTAIVMAAISIVITVL